MRTVRFVQKTSVPGGPLYHPGEVAELTDWLAERAVCAGNAEPIESKRAGDSTSPRLQRDAATAPVRIQAGKR